MMAGFSLRWAEHAYPAHLSDEESGQTRPWDKCPPHVVRQTRRVHQDHCRPARVGHIPDLHGPRAHVAQWIGPGHVPTVIDRVRADVAECVAATGFDRGLAGRLPHPGLGLAGAVAVVAQRVPTGAEDVLGLVAGRTLA